MPSSFVRFPLLFLLALRLNAADSLELQLKTIDGTGDAAMYVAWIETADGGFVRTLMMFSKDKKYYDHMTLWWKPHEGGEGAAVPDAMISPTLKWSAERKVSIPLDLGGGKNLLTGGYVLRMEQRKDKAGHYKKMRIPLTPDFTEKSVEAEGYLKSFTARVKKG
jgi:hypothetical protein